MSHDATNWAVKVRGIRPAAKVVLWHLADRHNADTGRCDPRQELLAADCEMSRASLNNQLRMLEETGFIQRVQRVNEKTKRQESTFYILNFDVLSPQDIEGRVQNLDTEAVSKNEPEPCPNLKQSRVQNLDTNLVREPGREPVRVTPLTPLEILCTALRQETARDFIAHRKAMRKPVTPEAAKRLLAKVRDHPDPDSVFDESIAQGWQGVFPERRKSNGCSSDGQAAERAERAGQRWAERQRTRGLDSGTGAGASQPLLSARQSE